MVATRVKIVDCMGGEKTALHGPLKVQERACRGLLKGSL